MDVDVIDVKRRGYLSRKSAEAPITVSNFRPFRGRFDNPRSDQLFFENGRQFDHRCVGVLRDTYRYREVKMSPPQTPRTAASASPSLAGDGEPQVRMLKLRLSTKPKFGSAPSAAAREGAIEPTPEPSAKATRRPPAKKLPDPKSVHVLERAAVNRIAAKRYRRVVFHVPDDGAAERYQRALVACGYLLAFSGLPGNTVRVGLYLAFQICLKGTDSGLHEQAQRDLGLTSSQVSLAVGKLEEVGLIAKSKVSAEKGDGRERRYRFKH